MADLIDVGPATFIFKFPKGSRLPKVGDRIEDNFGELLVIDTDTEKCTIKTIFIHKEPVELIEQNIKSDLLKCKEKIAQELFRSFETGMTALLEWGLLPDDTKSKFVSKAEEIINIIKSYKLMIGGFNK